MLFLTHHKCASSWLTKYLQKVSELNDLTFFVTHNSDALPPHRDIVALLNANYEYLHDKIDGGIHVIRNPFDLVCSAYYSHLETHSVEGWNELAEQRAILKTVSKDIGLTLTAAFLARYHYPGGIGPLVGMRTWNYLDGRFTTLRMEDVVQDVNYLVGSHLKKNFGPEIVLPNDQDFKFASFAGSRKPGEMDKSSHYRSGVAGQWRDELPQFLVDYIGVQHRVILENFYPEFVGADRT
jgi:hypothetical protein